MLHSKIYKLQREAAYVKDAPRTVSTNSFAFLVNKFIIQSHFSKRVLGEQTNCQ
jgi:hypothetical protein